MSKGKDEEAAADKRLGWIKVRVRQTFPHVKSANFNKAFSLQA